MLSKCYFTANQTTQNGDRACKRIKLCKYLGCLLFVKGCGNISGLREMHAFLFFYELLSAHAGIYGHRKYMVLLQYVHLCLCTAKITLTFFSHFETFLITFFFH